MERSTKIILGVILLVALGGLGFSYLKAPTKNGTSVTMSPVTPADWQIKATSTNVTFTEYGDFQCPACGAYYPIVKQLMSDYNGKITFVFRQFPLPMHQNAVPSAIAAEAAGNQGKFFEMADLLYTNQSEWSEATDTSTIFIGYAEKLGLDIEKFKADSADPKTKEKIVASVKEGVTSKVNSTPSFFINGVKVTNPSGKNEDVVAGFKKLIDEAISKETTQTATN